LGHEQSHKKFAAKNRAVKAADSQQVLTVGSWKFFFSPDPPWPPTHKKKTKKLTKFILFFE
jgi:hypothetical protein